MTTTVSPTQTAQAFLTDLEQALAHARQTGEVGAITDLFVDDCYWRDLVALSWNLTTAEGKDDLAAMLTATLPTSAPSNFQLEGEATEDDGVTTAWYTFTTPVLRGKGLMRLRDGKCWTFLTSAQELLEFPENKRTRRIKGAEHGVVPGRKNWLDRRAEHKETLGITTQPYTLIVGGGQGGIGLAARLRRLGVSTLVIDKHPKPGDEWRGRYYSLSLHDPVWYDHMPYLPFPDDWPVFTPKDKMGDWLESYVKIMELDYWSSTTCLGATFDDTTQRWTVEVERDGEKLTLTPTQLVLATGMSGIPNIPDIPGADTFEGDLVHSSQHSGGGKYAGKKAVVLGANNSAHDICGDLFENGADVTMIQRSTTHIVKSESLMREVLGPLYSEEALESGIDHETADLIFGSIPYGLLAEFQIPAWNTIREQDKEFYDKLESAGFMLDFGDDDSGLFLKYLRRGSGYYIDVGASELIADGKVKLKAPAHITEIKPHSVVLSDGTELEADLIVLATGYGSMNGWAAQLISQEVADKVGKCWGLGSNTTKDPGPWEGELRNMWKPTAQQNLWFHGGNLHQSRHYSRYLSLQLKAREAGMNVNVYGQAPVHHLQ
ncbi:FAD-dependent oxidoreductase [Williamsia sp. 1138]|uniref:NAD(P)/FAD-dependent oxidoreductase n=1 Tax=Williamsia sp. 1138 TaxID=1903117 RepID=UPI000A0F5B27|nr:NAD(P)/FAD-dependent oxidoreductase [Williamsia sp. 1138]OZG27080.1 FAD-dependent oxidoreductase [Williamsia sp. 1138]